MRYDQARVFREGMRDDEVCHCGRLKLFVNCCKNKLQHLEQRIHGLTLEQRSKLTADAVRFYLYQNLSADPYGQSSFTTDRVSQFYRYMSDLWPHRLRTLEALTALRDTSQLSGFYVGDPRPETILHNVSRLSLYGDRIFVPQPFYMPWALREDYDPVVHPGPVMQDTRRWAVATMLLYPWIEAGRVVFVPDPRDFDQQLREAFLAAGEKRYREGKVKIPEDDLERHERFFKADFTRQLFSLNDEAIIAQLRKHSDIPEEMIPEMLKYIAQQRNSDPLYVPGVAEHNPLMRIQVPTIEDTLLSCGLTNAFPFTDQRGKWDEITERIRELPHDAEIWSPLTRAFSECQLEFLNIEDGRLSFKIREEGYLTDFRSFMRDLWIAVDGTGDDRAFASAARDFSDRLREEHRKAVEEWKRIHAQFDLAIKNSAVTTAFGGLTSALTGLGFLGVALSFGAHALFGRAQAANLRAELASYRAKIPMSIFVDFGT